MQPPAPMEGLAYYTQSLLALWPEKAVIGSCVAGAVSLFGGDAYLLWMLTQHTLTGFTLPLGWRTPCGAGISVAGCWRTGRSSSRPTASTC